MLYTNKKLRASLLRERLARVAAEDAPLRDLEERRVGGVAPVAEHLAHDSSKRPQKSVCDFPREILGSYIFIPTQKFLDVSITKFSKVIPYFLVSS